MGHVSSIWNTTPFSHSMIQQTADHSFPRAPGCNISFPCAPDNPPPPPTGEEILRTSVCCILHQNFLFPCFPGIQSPIDPSSDLTGLGDVSGALESHCLENNEPLHVPAALPDSCELHGQRLDEAAPDSPAWCTIHPREHERQGPIAGLPCLVIFDTPTEVSSIVGVHPVPIYLGDPSVPARGNMPRKIPFRPLSVLHIFCLLLCRRCLRACVCLL